MADDQDTRDIAIEVRTLVRTLSKDIVMMNERFKATEDRWRAEIKESEERMKSRYDQCVVEQAKTEILAKESEKNSLIAKDSSKRMLWITSGSLGLAITATLTALFTWLKGH